METFKRYHKMYKSNDMNDNIDKINLKTLVAFGIPSQQNKLYNDFTIIDCPTVLDYKNYEDGIKKVQKVFNVMKDSISIIIIKYLVVVITYLGIEFMFKDTVRKIYANHSLVYSNVPL